MLPFTRLAKANSYCLLWKLTFTVNVSHKLRYFYLLHMTWDRSSEYSIKNCLNTLTMAQRHRGTHHKQEACVSGIDHSCSVLIHFSYIIPRISQVSKLRHKEVNKLPEIAKLASGTRAGC